MLLVTFCFGGAAKSNKSTLTRFATASSHSSVTVMLRANILVDFDGGVTVIRLR
jgi:hypothetical protein